MAWLATNFIASKSLAPFFEELIPALGRHGHLELEKESRKRITSISAATIDRILALIGKSCKEEDSVQQYLELF